MTRGCFARILARTQARPHSIHGNRRILPHFCNRSQIKAGLAERGCNLVILFQNTLEVLLLNGRNGHIAISSKQISVL